MQVERMNLPCTDAPREQRHVARAKSRRNFGATKRSSRVSSALHTTSMIPPVHGVVAAVASPSKCTSRSGRPTAYKKRAAATLLSCLLMNSFLLGIISDTHGLLRPEVLAALRGANFIIHAGDVGDPAILDQLKIIAPVFAVRGNVDTAPWTSVLPLTEVVQLDNVSIYVLHNLEQLDLDPAASGFQIVVSGHTHRPGSHWHDGVLYINPGSAGPRRFSLPITLARLDLPKTPWHVEFVQLPAA